MGRKESLHRGRSPADPAMLGIILVNEGSFFYLATAYGKRYPAVAGHGKYYSTELAPRFRDWLKAVTAPMRHCGQPGAAA